MKDGDAKRVKRVLILMSDTGGGHRASAEVFRVSCLPHMFRKSILPDRALGEFSPSKGWSPRSDSMYLRRMLKGQVKDALVLFISLMVLNRGFVLGGDVWEFLFPFHRVFSTLPPPSKSLSYESFFGVT